MIIRTHIKKQRQNKQHYMQMNKYKGFKHEKNKPSERF